LSSASCGSAWEYFDARAKIEEKDGQPWQNVEQFLSDEVLSVIELLEDEQ
jgi:hypothetical protein